MVKVETLVEGKAEREKRQRRQEPERNGKEEKIAK